MSNQFKTKAFKKLQAKWYSRLENEGFKDLEANEDSLIVYESTSFQNRYDPTQSDSTEEYYRLAGQFTHEYLFETKRDRLIWEMHSNGHGKREISEVIKKKRMPASSAQSVQNTVMRLRKEMLGKYAKRHNKPRGPDNN